MRLSILAITVLVAVSHAQAVNLFLLANGDFEYGDLRGTLPRWWQPEELERYPMELAPGWVEASSATVPGWKGAAEPVPVQLFCQSAPMYVYGIYPDDGGQRHVKRIGIARTPTPRNGYSLGWTLAGSGIHECSWIRQTVHIAPGKYLMDASWEVIVFNPSSSDKRTDAGMFIVNTDEAIGHADFEAPTFARTVWNTESAGKWLKKAILRTPIETKTGWVEVRLVFRHNGSRAIPEDKYCYVAFDDIVVELTPTMTVE